ncbi:hypothetical protein M758_11G164400 [Ceratodon purpureus]|nr:hypothetical protein M758_11G164400 [Ceratodon purpureus]
MWAFLGLGPAPASQFTANGRSAAWLISGSAAQRLSLDSMLTIPRIPRIPLPIVVMIYAWIMLCKWIPTDPRVRRELPIDFVPTPFRWIPNRIQFVRGGLRGLLHHAYMHACTVLSTVGTYIGAWDMDFG